MEKNAEKVQKTVEEIGGPEAIKEVLNKMSPKDKVELNQKIEEQKNKIEIRMKNIKENILNFKMFSSDINPANVFNEINKEINGIIAVPITAITWPVIGVAVGGGTGSLITGILSIKNKIKLNFEKCKLVKLEKHVA